MSLSFQAATSLALSLGLSICLGCKADSVQQGTRTDDAGVEIALEPPVLDVVPESTPNSTVAIRGTSNGKRVVVQGGTSTSITSVLPGGSFCGDVGLESGQATVLTVYAMGDGLISQPTEVVVTRDATAPVPPAPTCSGSTPPNCDVPEVCTNEADDNCDGWADNCDLQCNACEDDNFEPNDFANNVPLLAKGSYSLKICPCRDDWFAFERSMGQRLRATADFNHGTLPLNLRLYKASASGEQGDFVAGSFSSTNQEIIDEIVDQSTLYLLRVYSFSSTDDQSGGYQLTIE